MHDTNPQSKDTTNFLLSFLDTPERRRSSDYFLPPEFGTFDGANNSSAQSEFSEHPPNDEKQLVIRQVSPAIQEVSSLEQGQYQQPQHSASQFHWLPYPQQSLIEQLAADAPFLRILAAQLQQQQQFQSLPLRDSTPTLIPITSSMVTQTPNPVLQLTAPPLTVSPVPVTTNAAPAVSTTSVTFSSIIMFRGARKSQWANLSPNTVLNSSPYKYKIKLIYPLVSTDGSAFRKPLIAENMLIHLVMVQSTDSESSSSITHPQINTCTTATVTSDEESDGVLQEGLVVEKLCSSTIGKNTSQEIEYKVCFKTFSHKHNNCDFALRFLENTPNASSSTSPIAVSNHFRVVARRNRKRKSKSNSSDASEPANKRQKM